jgi:hypothetical protein
VLIETMKARGSNRALIGGIVYETRWSPEGQPRALSLLRCCGVQKYAQKNLVRLDDVIRADIHWNWKLRDPHLISTPDQSIFCFRHYQARDYKFEIDTRASIDAKPDESIAVPPPPGEAETSSDESQPPPAG